MIISPFMVRYFIVGFLLFVAAGCGTTKWTDTSRTATEQLLISYAIDHAVEQINFSVLAGKKVYVKSDAIEAATDYKYLSTAVRQHVATSGGMLCDALDQAEYVVELRTGAVGTDRNDLLYGVPAITIPSVAFSNATTGAGGTTIPEIPFVKKTDQRAVCKMAVFVYHKETGRPLWCSGNRQSESRAKAWWVFGAGPFTKGSIYNGTEFAGGKMPQMIPGATSDDENEEMPPLTMERYFLEQRPNQKEKAVATNENEKPGETSEAKAEPVNLPAPIPQVSPPQSLPESKMTQYGGIPIKR